MNETRTKKPAPSPRPAPHSGPAERSRGESAPARIIEVHTSYDLARFPQFDDVIFANVRRSDFSGAGCCVRDHGWTCENEIEAASLVKKLRTLGLRAKIKQREPWPGERA
jgi:hypothetical protein